MTLTDLVNRLRRSQPPQPVARKRKPKRSLKETDWLKVEEINALLTAAEANPRHYAMLSLFLYAGLRCNELRMLDLEDYIPATVSREATVEVRHAKGSKQRTVPAKRAVPALEYWLDERALGKGIEATCPALFRGRQGRLSNRYVRELIKGYGRAAGLGEKVHPHMLRHTYATHLTLNGVPIEVVQVLVGHVSIATTMLYVAVPDQRRFDAAAMLDFSRHAA